METNQTGRTPRYGSAFTLPRGTITKSRSGHSTLVIRQSGKIVYHAVKLNGPEQARELLRCYKARENVPFLNQFSEGEFKGFGE